MSRPLVSVILSAYNEERFLKDTIESILSQTMEDFEFIIVNDGSTDRTAEIIDNYKKLDNRIVIINNKNNIGLAKSLNAAIEKSSGRYLARMDVGDLSHNQRFEKQLKFLEARGDIYILGTQGYWIDDKKQIIGEWKMPLTVTDKELFDTGGAIHPSIMIRRELFDRIGLYDVNYEISLEFNLYMRTLKNGFGMANLPEALIYIMERDRGMTLSNLRITQLNQFKLKAKYLSNFLSFWNTFYTLRSLVGLLMPLGILDQIVKYLRRK